LVAVQDMVLTAKTPPFKIKLTAFFHLQRLFHVCR